ncbi:MAG: bile acid:sodium symporter family protein, partial [Bacteroidia bacterium]|nr:bile acid:sodium symporter family protein [Bacteroidia bacterium]
TYFQEVGVAALVFNLISMGVGFLMPQLFAVSRKQAISIGMEIGIHNGTLAIYIALNVLGNSVMSIPPAIYSLIMFFTAGAFGFLVSRKS